MRSYSSIMHRTRLFDAAQSNSARLTFSLGGRRMLGAKTMATLFGVIRLMSE